jgi:hypothetical protein
MVTTRYDQWVEFCREVDVLIHDAQYLESGMPTKHGWGTLSSPQYIRLQVPASWTGEWKSSNDTLIFRVVAIF